MVYTFVQAVDGKLEYFIKNTGSSDSPGLAPHSDIGLAGELDCMSLQARTQLNSIFSNSSFQWRKSWKHLVTPVYLRLTMQAYATLLKQLYFPMLFSGFANAKPILETSAFLKVQFLFSDATWYRCNVWPWVLTIQGSTQFASSVDSMVLTIQNSTLALACKKFKLGIRQEHTDRKAGRQPNHMTEVLLEWCESVEQALNSFNSTNSHECEVFIPTFRSDKESCWYPAKDTFVLIVLYALNNTCNSRSSFRVFMQTSWDWYQCSNSQAPGWPRDAGGHCQRTCKNLCTAGRDNNFFYVLPSHSQLCSVPC